jgi:hypothetical protein
MEDTHNFNITEGLQEMFSPLLFHGILEAIQRMSFLNYCLFKWIQIPHSCSEFRVNYSDMKVMTFGVSKNKFVYSNWWAESP